MRRTRAKRRIGKKPLVKRVVLDRSKILIHTNSPLSKNFAITISITPMSKVISKIECVEVQELTKKAVPMLTYIHSCYRTRKKANLVLDSLTLSIDTKIKFK